MSQFAYEGIDKSGEKTGGVIMADNFRAAARQLESRNLKIISLDVVTPKASKAVSTRKTKISKDDVILIFYEIATMLRAGVSLKEAVEAQCESGHTDAVLNVFKSLLSQLKSGAAFSAAVRNTELKIPDYMFHLIESGEMTGQLAAAIEQGVEQMEYDVKIQSETKSALIYPTILVLSGVVAVGIMFLFVVPKFSSLLSSADDMPTLAWLVISSGVWVNNNKLGVLIGFVVIVIAISLVVTQERFKIPLLNFLSRSPVIGGWLNESDIAVWSKMLGILLESKVPMLEALSLAAKSSRIPWRKARLAQVKSGVKSGMALSAALKREDVVSPTTVNLVKVGEKSGDLSTTLASVSRLYDQASKKRMQTLLSLIEPIAILVIGVVIGVIIMGIILAITSANDIAI
ncbi:type II secretion system F family protein [Alteromonas oceanisediminis]|uniref:type II secretion system F family protein n=1 Tax=Alteromonas oceanisediminis TaxID=2836180 RepID=UPI001BDA82B4|nr:type II secretion system F family protein [Alteromonas oceanisediminis]MBT0585044.1 type II secretion system F family protein [Alteromonas oceanisediminis]